MSLRMCMLASLLLLSGESSLDDAQEIASGD